MNRAIHENVLSDMVVGESKKLIHAETRIKVSDIFNEYNPDDLPAKVRLEGRITKFCVSKTRKGTDMAFFDFNDDTGKIDAVIFPDRFNKYKTKLKLFHEKGSPVILRGKVDSNDNVGPKLIVDHVC